MNEPMTDFQFKTILKMVLSTLDSSETLEEAKAKIQDLIAEQE